MAKKALDPNLAAILDSIRATVGSDAPPGTAADEEPPAAEPAAPAPDVAPVPRAPQQSVEEFLAALIRPQVQAWLDAHLPELVQNITAQEIARIIDRG